MWLCDGHIIFLSKKNYRNFSFWIILANIESDEIIRNKTPNVCFSPKKKKAPNVLLQITQTPNVFLHSCPKKINHQIPPRLTQPFRLAHKIEKKNYILKENKQTNKQIVEWLLFSWRNMPFRVGLTSFVHDKVIVITIQWIIKEQNLSIVL